MKIRKFAAGGGAGSGGAAGGMSPSVGLGTVHTADGGNIYTPTYGGNDKKKRRKGEALEELKKRLNGTTVTPRITVKRETAARAPDIKSIDQDIEWDKSKNPDHKTTTQMSASTSTTYPFMQNASTFGESQQGDELNRDGDKDEVKTDRQRVLQRKKAEQPGDLAGMSSPEPIPSIKQLPPALSAAGAETGSIDSKQKKPYVERVRENKLGNAFIGELKKMIDREYELLDKMTDTMDTATTIPRTITEGDDTQNYTGRRSNTDKEAHGGMKLRKPLEPPPQKNHLQVLGQ